MAEPALDLWPTESDRRCLLRLAGAPESAWAEVRGEAERLLNETARRLAVEVCDRASASAAELEPYATRLWRCLAYHAAQPPQERLKSFAALIRTAEQGGLVPAAEESNLLLDVMTAEAMERNHHRATERFERLQMPVVRGIARRMGGERAVEAVENFSAELILPRDNAPPRLRGYHGRTTLSLWLRAVVANYVVSRSRKTTAMSGIDLPEPYVAAASGGPDGRDCEGLLGPMFRSVVAATEAEPRLLLTLLLVDGVPQHQVAVALGIASGNVTRRRQRAVDDLLSRLHQAAAARKSERHINECLDILLAGDDREAAQRLGKIMADSLAADRTDGSEARR